MASIARHELLGEPLSPAGTLWELLEVRHVLDHQRTDGRWSYPNVNPGIRSADDYDQLETYRQLGVLVCKYGLDRRHPAIERATAFLRSFQTEAGDYRGIYGRQYTPNYSAAITELLIRAGYTGTAQVEATMRWLMSARQDDGGWAIPTRTHNMPLRVMLASSETVEPDRSRPSSHLVTGIVLRAFAVHPGFRHAPATRRAGDLLKSRFFTRDRYPDQAAPSYWLRFSHPFWWTDLLSALTALTDAGFSADDPDIACGISWFVDNQESNGFWNTGHNRPRGRHSDQWVGLAVCRMLKTAGYLTGTA